MADRVIEIIIDTNDKTGGKLEGLKRSLLEIDAQAQKLHAKFASMGSKAYSASIRLIDRVTEPGSKINSLLRSLANKSYTLTMRLNDSVLSKVRSIEAGLMRLAGRAYTVAVNLKDNVSGKLKGITEGALMATGAGVLGAAGVGYGAVNALQSYMGFEKQMSAVQAVRQLEKDSPEMVMLTQQAKDLGATTAWTRQEVGEAQYYEALAGWSVPLIEKATPALLNLASAGNVSLRQASDIVTDAMTAFGIKADEVYVDKQGRYVNAAEHFIDMFAKLQASSNTDILQAGEAFHYGAPIIGAMYAGKDIQTRMQAAEDTMVMVGLQANAGIKGSMGGTGISTTFQRIGGENRNTFFSLAQLLGVKYRDEQGDFLAINEIMGDMRQKFTQGLDPAKVSEAAEIIAGQKIQADTRRKVDSFIEQTLANGGKIGSADMIKLAQMIGGTEHSGKLLAMMMGDVESLTAKMDDVHGTAAGMAKTQLDNLAGSFTMLSSAWDAFQQSFFEGEAGSGLRSFVDSLTELVSRANKLFADGIQLGDIGNIVADAVDRLRSKFLALDGVGSVLAGGALIAGLMKIGSLAQRVMVTLKNLRGLQVGQRLSSTTSAGTVSAGQKIGTMTVSAGVVNVNGRVSGVGRAGSPVVGSSGAGTNIITNSGSSAPNAVGLAQSRLAKEQKELARLQSKSDMALARAWSQPGNERLQSRYRALQGQVVAAERSVARAQEQVVVAQSRQAAQVRTQSFVSDYYARKEQEQIAAQARAQRWSNMRSAALGGGLFSGVFAAMDVFNAKSLSQEMNADVEKRLSAAETEYRSLVAGGAETGHLAQQREVIEGLRQEQAQVIAENQVRERETLAGASGSVIGAAIGAGLGSFLPGFGTMLGGIIGSVIGEKIGVEASKIETPASEPPKSHITDEQVKEYMGGKSRRTFFEMEPDYSFDESGVAQAVPVRSEWSAMPELKRGAGHRIRSFEERQVELDVELAAFKEESARRQLNFWREKSARLSSLNQHEADSGFEYYRKQREGLAERVQSETAGNWQTGFDFLRDFFGGGKASAASLSEEQLLQQAAMERPLSEQATPITEPLTEPLTQPDLSSFEQIFSDMESFKESIGELFTGMGESITENLTGAFEGVGEVFSGFTESVGEELSSAFDGLGEYFSEIGEVFSTNLTTALESVNEVFDGFSESITENLTGAFEGVGEFFATIGEMIGESLTASLESAGEIFAGFGEMIATNLSGAFEGAAEIFAGFGEMVLESLASAQASAEGALAAIGASFSAAKEMIQSSWAELPGFFGGIFEGLGGVAASAGAAIASGLTAPIGSIVGAWQSAAAQISSIIASIQAQSAAASTISVNAGGVGKAEGGFVTSETHFFAGEHGPEVIIPLSSSRRSRAMDLLEKTTAILGGEAIPAGDYAKELPSLDDNYPIPTLDSETSVALPAPNNQTQVTLGGVNVTFTISGNEPQDIMQTIRENLEDLADKIGGQLATKIGDCFGNMPLEQ